MSVKAKFRCSEVAHVDYGNGYSVSKVLLFPVYDNSEENKEFWNATPTGRLEMDIRNEAAAKHFEAGKEYYLSIEKAE